MTISMSPMKWSKLTHVDEIEPLNHSDETVLSDVRRVLLEHDALDRFGVFLVHKHFELEEDEYVLEETDEDAREQRLVVRKTDQPHLNTIQTMWKFAEYGDTTITKCVLRCHYQSGHKQKHFKEGH